MFEILVNGEKIDAGKFGYHAQAEPYPGGKFFTISMTDPDFISILRKRFGDVEVHDINQQSCNYIFNLLRLIFGPKYQVGTPEYWGNSIVNMNIFPDRVVISGVCSPQKD